MDSGYFCQYGHKAQHVILNLCQLSRCVFSVFYHNDVFWSFWKVCAWENRATERIMGENVEDTMDEQRVGSLCRSFRCETLSG
jgi:hypothetical protein